MASCLHAAHEFGHVSCEAGSCQGSHAALPWSTVSQVQRWTARLVPLKDYGDTTFITGLRAYACLAVVLAHTGGGGFRGLGAAPSRFIHFANYGVTVFFVISGFSVAASYAACGGFRAHMTRRILRVAPLYYLWMGIAIATGTTAIEWQERYSAAVGLYNVGMHALFLSFLDYRIACTILGVEWSLPIEVVWYAAIPALLVCTRTPAALTLAVIGAVLWLVPVAALKRLLPLPPDDAAYAILWSPLPHAPAFVLGVAAYRIRKWCPGVREYGAAILLVGVCAVVCLASAEWSLPAAVYPLFFAMFTASILAAGSQASAVFNALFCNSAALFVGTISYGLYLSHFPVMRALSGAGVIKADGSLESFMFTTSVACLLSALTYRFVERPAQRLALPRGFK